MRSTLINMTASSTKSTPMLNYVYPVHMQETGDLLHSIITVIQIRLFLDRSISRLCTFAHTNFVIFIQSTHKEIFEESIALKPKGLLSY